MDIFTMTELGIMAAEKIDEWLGEECPKCGSKTLFGHEEKGKTWFGNKKKVKCGNCGHVFKVKVED